MLMLFKYPTRKSCEQALLKRISNNIAMRCERTHTNKEVFYFLSPICLNHHISSPLRGLDILSGPYSLSLSLSLC